MTHRTLALSALVSPLVLSFASPVLASPYDVQSANSAVLQDQGDERLSQFTPRTTNRDDKIDYSIWGVALKSMVIGLGPSTRQGARRPDGYLGTRIFRGHKSRLRLEGSRIAYSFFNDDVTASLTEYRQDLERVGTDLDIPSLSRNEQLAYWLNLHNVAMIEQIAVNYPQVIPSEIEIDGALLDEARFLEVDGTKLSLRDIRERIVYPNWSDPRVIYGFFRGDIGGPMIQPEEFNARNLDFMLSDNAVEFINSLRGTERRGKTLHVSKLYEEAAQFYFPDLQNDLKPHLAEFAEEEVTQHLEKSDFIRPTIYEDDIADLARGQKQPVLAILAGGRTRYPPNLVRFLGERQKKFQELRIDGTPVWTIRLIPMDLPGQPSTIPEIE
ncbi:MAG: DUF547 domain-containing protein [Pseudomonadota bacterium]